MERRFSHNLWLMGFWVSVGLVLWAVSYVPAINGRACIEDPTVESLDILDGQMGWRVPPCSPSRNLDLPLAVDHRARNILPTVTALTHDLNRLWMEARANQPSRATLSVAGSTCKDVTQEVLRGFFRSQGISKPNPFGVGLMATANCASHRAPIPGRALISRGLRSGSSFQPLSKEQVREKLGQVVAHEFLKGSDVGALQGGRGRTAQIFSEGLRVVLEEQLKRDKDDETKPLISTLSGLRDEVQKAIRSFYGDQDRRSQVDRSYLDLLVSLGWTYQVWEISARYEPTPLPQIAEYCGKFPWKSLFSLASFHERVLVVEKCDGKTDYDYLKAVRPVQDVAKNNLKQLRLDAFRFGSAYPTARFAQVHLPSLMALKTALRRPFPSSRVSLKSFLDLRRENSPAARQNSPQTDRVQVYTGVLNFVELAQGFNDMQALETVALGGAGAHRSSIRENE